MIQRIEILNHIETCDCDLAECPVKQNEKYDWKFLENKNEKRN